MTDKTEESNGKEEENDEISKEDTKEIVEEVYGESDVMKYLCLQQNEEKNDTKEAKEEEEDEQAKWSELKWNEVKKQKSEDD